MIFFTLPGLPKLAQTPDWNANQRQDFNEMWLDIKRVLDNMRFCTGVTGAIATGTTVLHNLGAIPNVVILCQQDGTPSAVFPSAFTLTTFTVNYTGGGTHIFSWWAGL